jgi:hypothetical protein
MNQIRHVSKRTGHGQCMQPQAFPGHVTRGRYAIRHACWTRGVGSTARGRDCRGLVSQQVCCRKSVADENLWHALNVYIAWNCLFSTNDLLNNDPERFVGRNSTCVINFDVTVALINSEFFKGWGVSTKWRRLASVITDFPFDFLGALKAHHTPNKASRPNSFEFPENPIISHVLADRFAKFHRSPTNCVDTIHLCHTHAYVLHTSSVPINDTATGIKNQLQFLPFSLFNHKHHNVRAQNQVLLTPAPISLPDRVTHLNFFNRDFTQSSTLPNNHPKRQPTITTHNVHTKQS